MDLIGIIAEFNPFHTGHAALLQQIRRHYGPTVPVVIILSGSFVQRGEPALFDKWQRTSWALRAGADIVVELPTVYALSAAPFFAAGARRLAAAVGCTHLACGTEIGTAEDFMHLAELRANVEHFPLHRTSQTYGTYMTRQLQPHLSPSQQALLQAPNALLAGEYALAIQRYAPHIKLHTFCRKSRHDQQTPTNEFASASFLRSALPTRGLQDVKKYIPPAYQEEMQHLIRSGQYTDYNRYGDFVLYAGRRYTAARLQHVPAFTEGLEHRWIRCVTQAATWDNALQALKTKRYSYRRLCRMGAYVALQATRELFIQVYEEGPSYIRLLGNTQRGRTYLKEKNCTLPCIYRPAPFMKQGEPLLRRCLQFDHAATDLQYLSFHNPQFRQGLADFYHKPCILP